MKYGLIIQGPRYSFGSGPNNARTDNGYDALGAVLDNVARFHSHVDMIVVSTWFDSGFEVLQNDSRIELLRSTPPSGFDYLNQTKQFFSMSVGIEFLLKNSDCSHIIKIRTDQLMPEIFIEWLDEFFRKQDDSSKKIVCSEQIHDQAFYVGDFVFAGPRDKMANFARNVLSYQGQRIVLNNSIDYTLKHLINTDERVSAKFWKNNLIFNEMEFLFKHKDIDRLWNEVSNDNFVPLPIELYKDIFWRGLAMSEVFSSSFEKFSFYEDSERKYINTGKYFKSIKGNEKYVPSLKKLYFEMKRFLKAKILYIIKGTLRK